MTNQNKYRDVNGILLINKPTGVSSNFILQKVRRYFKAKKAGHTGSLDPLATGMLPICFGEATKVSHYLLQSDKQYIVSAMLGAKTTTSDVTGEVTHQTSDFSISIDMLNDALQAFRGKTQQIPSMYSALKHCGQPLYRYARQGIEIERQARNIQVDELTLLSFDGKTFCLRVTCSKGTYIRNLVEDIGEHLAVGAYVTKLHRVYTDPFSSHPMHEPHQFEPLSHGEQDNYLLPIDLAIQHLPALYLLDTQVKKLRQGQVIVIEDTEFDSPLIRIYEVSSSQFIGIGQYENNQLSAKRLLAYSF